MADIITPAFGLVKLEDGSHNNTWGDITNNNMQRIEDRLTLLIPVPVTGTNIFLTETQQKIGLCFEVTGTLSGSTLIFFTEVGLYLVRNNTAGNFALSATMAAQAPATQILRGETMILYCDGAKIVQVGADLKAAFSAVMTFDQAIPHDVPTGIAMQGLIFDTGSHYNVASSSWFPPQGVVMLNFSWSTPTTLTGTPLTVIFKNGVPYKWTAGGPGMAGGQITLIDPSDGVSYYAPGLNIINNAGDILVQMGGASWWNGQLL